MAKTKPSSDQKALLLSSMAQYLERSGFTKTLKKFHSEAQFEKDGIKDSPPDLEEIYKTYFESRSDSHAAVDLSGSADTKKSEEIVANGSATGQNVRSKEKKKTKKTSDSLDQCNSQVSLEVQLEEPNNKVKEKKKKKSKVLPESLVDKVENQLEPKTKGVSKSEKENKSKDRKKKKENVTSDSLVDNTEENDDIETSKVDEAFQDGKASKKRKRVVSEENYTPLADNKAVDETDPNNGKENKTESGELALKDAEKTPMKMNNGQENGSVGKSTEKMSKKQRIGSAEPTSLKAFQRIKLDEVVFTDERLQDNSYWAKGGAETGYGAKAQEVLGQVRGRGFRHEKTKKKRGSYRGGQIDQQSHSVKFNYSDEE